MVDHYKPTITQTCCTRDDIIEAQYRRQQAYTQPSLKPTLPNLQQGQSVTMYNHNTSTWQPATVTQVLPAPRSYQLSTDNGGKYRRNRRDIRSIPQSTPKRVTTQPNVSTSPEQSASNPTQNYNQPVTNTPQPHGYNGYSSNKHYVTKSGRISKPVTRYQ